MAEIPGKPINLGGVAKGLPTYTPSPSYSPGPGNDGKGALSFEEMVSSIPTGKDTGASSIPTNSLYIGDRYKYTFPFRNTEEMAAQQQSAADRWANGFAKMAGTTATTFLAGTVGTVVGVGNYIGSGFKFSAFYDNPVNRGLDAINNKMEDYLPNYYTQAEKDANWFGSENLLTANFWSDKVIKNVGFAIGTLAGGFVWGAALRAIGLTNRLVQAGKGLETATKVEEAIAAAAPTARFGAISNTLSTLSNQYLRPLAATALTNADRGLVSVMGTMGESSFESLQAMNGYRDKMIDAYFEKYGTRPTGEDLDEINQYAENVGNFTWGMNAALLTATNYIQLPKILSSSRNAERRLMNDVVKSKVDDAATLTEKVGAKFEAAPSVYQTVAGGAGRVFQKFVARPIGLLFSPTEAFEEGAQFAISTGVDDYFNRAFENREDTSSFFANLGGALKNVFSTGVNETLSSKEGMESILIGGISGGIQTSFSPFGMSEVRERGLSGEGGVRKRNTDIALEELNRSKKLNEVFKDAVKYINIGINSQKLRREAISENDTLSEKDYEKDYALSYIMPRVKYGKLDSIKEELNLYKQTAMSEQGFAELYADGIVLQNETREKFLQRVERVRENAESVAKIYETFDDSYSSVVDDSGKRKYSDNVIEKMVYATARIADYDERLASLDDNLSGRGVSTSAFKNALVGTEAWKEGNIREALKSPEVEEALVDVANFINDQELDVTKNELRRDFGDFAEMALRRKLFIDEFNGILKSPEKYEEEGGFAEEIESETGAVVKQQVVPEGAKRKKTIDKELEFGREYSLRQLGRIEGGKLKAAPKITVLSKTVFGDLEVKLPDGKVVFMKPEEFRSYDVVEDVIDDAQAEEIVNDAIDTVLKKRKYSSIPKPEGNKVAYVNSLNNPQLLADIAKEIAARSEKFFETSEKEERTSKEQSVNQALVETSDNGVQTREPGAGSFEPDSRKTDQEVVNSTKPPVEAYSQEEPLAEHHVRANRFGANFYTFANRDNFRGVIVTQGNQAQLGIPGLTQWLKDKGRGGEEVDPAKTIALVVMGIDPITNERYFVGENGEKLAKPTLDTIIYQAFPESLQWSGGGSMFRETTPDDVRKALTKDYMAWREATLKSPTNDLYRISASFGSPRYVGELNEKGQFKTDPTARVAVEDSGLVSEKELRTKRVVGVPTTDGAVVYGSSTFNDVKGVPILYSHNGLVRLDNRNITKGEAELIYSAIQRLASNLFKDKNLKSGESVMLYNWLKSVIYWGTPKDPQGNRKPAGFSSVFFENQQLIMGKEEKKFSIKPSALKANKAAIVEELQKMYNNVNSTLVSGGQKKDWNKPYTEITAITPEGIQTREWKNYQSFLLSKKNPDGSARNPKTIPLTTRIRPLKDSQDTNRKGIYFTLIDKKGNTSQEVPPKEPAKKVVVPPTATEAKKTQPVKKFDLQGKENILPTKLGDIPFTIDKKKFDETDGKQGILLPDPATDPQYKLTLEGAVTKLSTIPNSGVTEDTPDEQATAVAENVLRNLIRAEIKKQLAPAPAPAPAAPAPVPSETKINIYAGTGENADLSNFAVRPFTDDGIGDLGMNYKEVTGKSIVFNTVEGFFQASKIQYSNSSEYWNKSKDGWTLTKKGIELIEKFAKATGSEAKSLGRTIKELDTKEWDKYSSQEMEGGLLASFEQNPDALRKLLATGNATLTHTQDKGKWGKEFPRLLMEVRSELVSPAAAPVSDVESIEKRRQEELNKAFDNNKGALESQIKNAVKSKGWDINNVLFHGGPKFDKFKKEFFQTGEYSNVDMRRVAQSMGVRIPEGSFSFSATPMTALNYALTYGKNNPTLYIVNNTKAINAEELTGNDEKDAQEWIIDGDNISDIITVPLIPNADEINARYDKLVALEAPVSDIEAKKAEADKLTPIEQNFADGQGGRKMQPKFAGKSTMDLILSGDRTRTTRANTDIQRMIKDYGLSKIEDLVGKVIRMTDKKGRVAYTEITKVAPFTQEYQDATWQKEGWEKSVTDANVGKYPYAIEFKLAALEGAKPAEAKPAIAPSLQERVNQRKKAGPTKRGSDFRLMIAKDLEKLKPENWSKVEQWLKTNYPNIPVYRVKNYILAANGMRAHGMFKDGAIYLSETGEVGTVYHEVFHAVWQALTDPAERAQIASEFRGRNGVFFDRASLKNVKYADATDKQMEEKLAEELRDYIQEGKVPQKPAGPKSLIAKLFADIVNFFKTFFTGEKAAFNTEELFKKIGSGYFAQTTPYDSPLSFAKRGFIDIDEVVGGELADYNLDVFTGEQVHDLMQHMTYITVRDLFEENEGLFQIVKKKKAGMYDDLQEELGDLMADNVTQIESMIADGEITAAEGDVMIGHYNTLYKNILDNWDSLVEKHEEYIRSYNIEFDENDEIDLNTLEKGKDDPYGDARKIDNMRKTNAAVKLLLASLPIIQSDGTEKLSSIGGYTLLPMSEIFMGVMNNVHTSRSMTEMLSRVKAMSEDDPKYIKLYNRLSRLKNIDELDNAADLQLLSAFWRSFKKQSPAVKTVYILDNGDVQVGDSNFTTAARQVKDEFVNDIKEAIAKGSKYFKKSDNGKSYVGNAEAIKKDVKQDSLEKQVAFLNEIGIEFDGERLAMLPERTKFSEAVNGIRTSIANGRSVMTIGGRTLDIDLRLRQLAEIKAKMDNPEFSSTYYNVNGELTQTFIGTNAASDLYDMLSQIDNLSELTNTQYEYLLTDSFAKNSVLLYKMFDRESGDRIQDTEDIMQPGYADGTVNEKKGRQRESSKLNYKERLVQEINLNMAGFYLNLVPGDASIEHMSNMGNFVDKSEILTNYNRVHTIFRGYLEDEVALVKEDRPVADGKNPGDLRFFKSILGEELQKKVLAYEGSITELYASEDVNDVKLVNDINEAIDKFINRERDRTRNLLAEYGAIKVINNQLVTEGLSFGRDGITDEELNNQLATLSINYAINNIELHKLLYSDPYQYSDELKRIKNFHSPRQAIINSSDEMNTAFHQTWNKGFAEGDLGFTDFERDFFRAATVDDVESMSDLEDYGTFKETDGGGIITLKALRNFKIRAGEWDDSQEAQYKYDIVWEKQDKGGKLTGAEKKIFRKGNPRVMRTYTPIKPIVSGNKANDRPYNDVVLDKFALYPFSYRMLKEMNPTSNAIKLYDKMQAEDVDYVVFKSGRKVGAEKTFSLYDKKSGNFNTEPFETQEQKDNPMLPQTVLNVPFAIMSIQSDVPSKEENEVTRGSQMTKLATLDFMAAGVPIDFRPDIESFTERYNQWFALDEDGKLAYNGGDNLYKEIKNNQDILEALVEEGVYALTSEFGLTKVDEGYKIESLDKVADAIRREVTKREVNDNISAALKGYKSGSVILEATPAYQQIRNVLYSIADRNVMSPKMSGGMKVQIPSTLLESGTRKVKDGVYASDILKFYEDKDGKRYCEIMVARWFKSDLSDDELLDELKKTGILEGVGFRIPTQKQNSIDSFVIKRFLPEEFGDAVVIPSALVKKVGSDFDIDKLNVYLKNVDVNPTTGEIRLIPYQGANEEARNKFKYRSDFKKSLENGYIESLQKLVSHPLNFKNLVKPNSADQMKKLSREIVDKLGLGTFDYNIAGNMISRRFMSRLRHALVTGKYAIGIAAVAQTNHSLNQRTPIYIDFEGRKDMLSLQDRKFLGDGKIKFAEYNTIVVGDKVVPTVSMIESAKKKNPDTISDTIGQFIDGYVDISKDTWIMEIGATPTVASTWLFLIKVGVPIETVSYFMNQPIIREYLREIEKTGSNWLFDERLSKKLLEKNLKYKGKAIKVEQVPANDVLFDMIGKKELNNTEKAQQRFMLREFLKYSKMGQQLFYVTQGTNFDTSSFNDPFLIFKKLYQLDKARKTIFSSVDDILESSFLGKMKDGLLDVRNAYSEVLLSDRRGTLREIIQDVLTPYVNMNDRDFIRTSQRVVSTLFDWAKQVDDSLAERIGDVLLSKDKNVAKRMKDFVTPILDPKNSDHPLHNNHVLKLLRFDFADSEQQVNNIKLANKTNKVYDQNQIIYAFKELKNYLKSQNNEELYNDLLTLAVLQSGLTPSTISFTNLLPYEDLVGLYNSSIANLPGMTSLNAFRDLNVFERTFWNYDDVVPHMEAKYVTDYLTGVTEYNTNMAFKPEIYNAMKTKELPILLKVSPISREANYDVIVYTYEKQISPKEKREMRNRGDYSYIKRGLFKKVGLVDNGTGVMTFIYKAINAWGDGIYAKEFYDTARKSQIDNGYIESDETITDAKILSYFGIAPTASEEVEDDAAPDVVETEGKEAPTVEREYTPEKITSLKPNEVFVFGSNTEGRHGAGAALTAKQKFGAKQGQAEGLQGQSYAIITKDLAKGKRSIPLYGMDGNSIAEKVRDFVEFANSNPQLKFYVTKLGSKLAGYSIEEMKGVFDSVNKLYITQDIEDYIPNNVVLSEEYEVRGKLAQPAQAVVDFDSITEFTPERKTQIIANFAKKHKLTEAKAKEYINDAMKKDAKKVINKLKECY